MKEVFGASLVTLMLVIEASTPLVQVEILHAPILFNTSGKKGIGDAVLCFSGLVQLPLATLFPIYLPVDMNNYSPVNREEDHTMSTTHFHIATFRLVSDATETFLSTAYQKLCSTQIRRMR